MRIRSIGVAALLAALTHSALAQTKPVAIMGARIEIGNGTVIENGTVIVRDGKISRVEGASSISGDYDVIDGKGMVLYPGFIDAYTTRGVKLPDAPAAGTPPDSRSTAPPSMWPGNRKGVRLDVIAGKCLDLKDQVTDNYKQGILSALVCPGGGAVRGIASVVTYSEKGEVLIPTAAAELSWRGGSGQGTADGYPGSNLGVIALVRQTLADVQNYIADAPEKKQDEYENLRPLLEKQIPAVFVIDSEREMIRTLRIADEFVIRPIFASGREAYKQIDLLKTRRIPVLVTLDLDAEPSRSAAEGSDTPKDVLEERYQRWQERAGNVRALSDAGVTFAFSSVGAGLDNYLKNVRTLVTRGLSKQAALRAMTVSPAEILGVSDRLGSIEAGKDANLVLMSGDFADPASVVKIVFVGGNKIEIKKEAAK